MSTAELPYMKWYPSDWLGSESRAVLSLAGRAAYRDLLDRAWTRPECVLPRDDRQLAALAGCTPAEWAEVRDEVLARFDELENGYRCRRQWEDLQARLDESEAQRGRINKRWEKHRGGKEERTGAAQQGNRIDTTGTTPVSNGNIPDRRSADTARVPAVQSWNASGSTGSIPPNPDPDPELGGGGGGCARAREAPDPEPGADPPAGPVPPPVEAFLAEALRRKWSEPKLRRTLRAAMRRLRVDVDDERLLRLWLRALLADATGAGVRDPTGLLLASLSPHGDSEALLEQARADAAEWSATITRIEEIRGSARKGCPGCGGQGYRTAERRDELGRADYLGRAWNLNTLEPRHVGACDCAARGEEAA